MIGGGQTRMGSCAWAGMVIAALASAPLSAAGVPAGSAGPSFDCAKAEMSAEKLVCQDAALAALDRETARLYDLAAKGPHLGAERRKELIATQRGWIGGRNECWKKPDLRECVQASYVERIHELRQGYSEARGDDRQGISRGPLVASCPGLDALVGVTFVDVAPPLVHLQWREESRVLALAPGESGRKYEAKREEGATIFWVEGDSARLELPGRAPLQCALEKGG